MFENVFYTALFFRTFWPFMCATHVVVNGDYDDDVVDRKRNQCFCV